MGKSRQLNFKHVLIVSPSIKYRRGLAEVLLKYLVRPRFSVLDPNSRDMPDHSHDWADIDLTIIDLSTNKSSVRSWFFDYPNKDVIPPIIFFDSRATVDDAGDLVRAGAADYVDIRKLKKSRLARALVIASAMVTARCSDTVDGQYSDTQATEIIDVIQAVNTDTTDPPSKQDMEKVVVLDDPEATGLLPVVDSAALVMKDTQIIDKVNEDNPSTEVLPQVDIESIKQEDSTGDKDRAAMAAMGILTEEITAVSKKVEPKTSAESKVAPPVADQAEVNKGRDDQLLATGLMSILEKNRVGVGGDSMPIAEEPKSSFMGQRWPFTHGDIEQGKASLGEYDIQEFIGVGGTASVFRVSRKSDGKEFAMKLFDTDSPDKLGRDRFSRGYKLLQSIQHPNVCHIEELVNNGDHTYVVLELLPCGDLRSRINMGIERDEAVRFATQIGAALYRAHSQDVIHRDLKPSNILFRTDGSLALVDFGIAKQMAEVEQQMTQRGQVVGTPYYISPEQATGEFVDHRGDLYALGVILFEMLEGKRPYEGETSMEIMTAHVRQPIPHLGNKGDSLNGVVSRLLSKAPEERFPSGKDLVLALKSICPNGVSLETLKTVV